MTAETVQSQSTASELDEPVWAVVSFERVEAIDLTYPQASDLMSQLDGRKVPGLCILSNNAAARIKTPK